MSSWDPDSCFSTHVTCQPFLRSSSNFHTGEECTIVQLLCSFCVSFPPQFLCARKIVCSSTSLLSALCCLGFLFNLLTLLQVVFSSAALSIVCLGFFRSYQVVLAGLKVVRFFVVSMCFTVFLIVLGCLGSVTAFQVVSSCWTMLILSGCFKLFESCSSCLRCQKDLACSDCVLMCFSKDRTMFQVVVGGVVFWAVSSRSKLIQCVCVMLFWLFKLFLVIVGCGSVLRIVFENVLGDAWCS